MRFRRRRDRREAELSLRPISNWMLVLAVVAVLLAGVGLTRWLLSIAATDPSASASVQIDAIRTGLSAAVGTGGAFALLLAFRRQRSTEVSAVHTITDATERRVTELYTKAADQLGSDKAPVRLAGLYALERLAQDNPTQRQTIVNIICAYLQMPYTPPRPLPVETFADSPFSAEGSAAEDGGRADQGRERYEKRVGEHEKRAQEHRVRTTAQRILSRHLLKKAAEDLRWSTTVDLSGAYLAQADLSGATLTGADLSGASLAEAHLVEADLTGADLSGANLFEAHLGRANLSEAHLSGANLSEAHLSGADLTGADLGEADLSGAFLGKANLTEAILGKANLTEAILGKANLTKARLGKANLTEAILAGANLTEAFLEGADLTKARLDAADLSGAFLDGAGLTEAFLGRAELTEAILGGAELPGPILSGAYLAQAILGGAELPGAILGGASWDEGTNWPPNLRDRIKTVSVNDVRGGFRIRDTYQVPTSPTTEPAPQTAG